ncbi:hypothetical protein B0H11DRAFT_1915007 [Mycena galericulata]|nr:hypothetical protein B0H11DRAFT_1915007 [Mycena galericulata]
MSRHIRTVASVHRMPGGLTSLSSSSFDVARLSGDEESLFASTTTPTSQLVDRTLSCQSPALPPNTQEQVTSDTYRMPGCFPMSPTTFFPEDVTSPHNATFRMVENLLASIWNFLRTHLLAKDEGHEIAPLKHLEDRFKAAAGEVPRLLSLLELLKVEGHTPFESQNRQTLGAAAGELLHKHYISEMAKKLSQLREMQAEILSLRNKIATETMIHEVLSDQRPQQSAPSSQPFKGVRR